MSYKCYLFGELMPETPGKLTIKINSKNKTLDLLNEGEVNFIRLPGLTEVTLPLTFPMLAGSKKPEYYLGLLEKAKTSRETTQFIMTRTAPNGVLFFDTNMKVSVEDYTVTENAENGLDLSVEVKLKQYRDFTTKVFTVNTEQKNTESDSNQTAMKSTQSVSVSVKRNIDNAPKAKTHTVKSGDTLWALAVKYLRDGSKYNLIYNANKDKISNPNLIYAGQVLTIPNV